MKRFAVALLSIFAVLTLFVPAATEATRPGASTKPTGEAQPRVDVNAPAVPGQFLVKYRADVARKARNDDLAAKGGAVVDRVAALDVEVVEFAALTGKTDAKAAEAMINALKQNPAIEYVEPNYIYTVNFTPNDPSYGSQWAWNRIQAPQAWDVTQGSSSVVVAIVDTGIQRNHPDLDAKIVGGYDYVSNDNAADDGNGHGTHVGGTVAAETNNGTGGAGTCPNCRLMPIRVLDNNGSGTLANVANGITYASQNGAKVINLSLGGGGSSTLQSAVDNAWNNGVFLACAAGNSNTSSTGSAYPAAYANCFAIASTTSSDARSSFSNYGSWVEIAAPGSSIYSTWINSGYNTISGTSMATPHVAGLAGLLASQGLSNSQIRDRLCATADDISGTGTSWTCGRINALRAVSNGGSTPTPTPPPGTPVPTPTPPPGGTNRIVNGGFESGTSPWVQASSGGYALITTNRPRTGAYSVYGGGYNRATETIYQTVTVPANGILTYSWYMTTSESGSTAYDYLRVRLYSSGGSLLSTLKTHSNASGAGVWRTESVNLGAYAGQTVRVHFGVTTDGSLVSSFFVDDVSLQ